MLQMRMTAQIERNMMVIENLNKAFSAKSILRPRNQKLLIELMASTYEWLAFFTSRAAVLNCNQLVRQYAWEY